MSFSIPFARISQRSYIITELISSQDNNIIIFNLGITITSKFNASDISQDILMQLSFYLQS